MPWEAPSYVEVAMSAEIGAYQDELERKESPLSAAVPPAADEAAAPAAS